MKKTRILLADDQILFVDSLKIVISTIADDMEVVGIAHDGREAVNMIANLSPDIVLLDVRMPVMDGVETTRVVRSKHPEVKIMILTTFNDDEYVREAMQAGAEAYILKDMPAEVLITSIRAVSSGTILISPEIAAKVFTQSDQPNSSPSSARGRDILNSKLLTDRDREILKLIAEGLDNKDIAEHLFLAEQTVKNRVSDIYAKLGVHDRINAARFLQDS